MKYFIKIFLVIISFILSYSCSKKEKKFLILKKQDKLQEMTSAYKEAYKALG